MICFLSEIYSVLDQATSRQHDNVTLHFGASPWHMCNTGLLYAFSKSFSSGKFFLMKLALRQKICASLEPWVYQLGSLKLTHVLPENSIVATESLALYWLLYPQEFLFYLICFWCKYLFVLNISSSSFVIYCLTFKNRWLLLICFICYIFQLYILFFLTGNPGNCYTWFKTNSREPL